MIDQINEDINDLSGRVSEVEELLDNLSQTMTEFLIIKARIEQIKANLENVKSTIEAAG